MTSLALLANASPGSPSAPVASALPPGAMPSVPAHDPPPPSDPTGDGRLACALDAQSTDRAPRAKDTASRAARNRLNAARSTGPRTPAGKARSAQNARTHGLAATTLPVPDPTARLEYTTALVELRDEHRPSTPTQHALVDELALILWKLQYLPRIEHRLLNTPLPDDTPEPDPQHVTPHPRLDHDRDPTARVLAAHFAQDKPTPLTRLFAHQNRLHARTNSILNQLRRLKRDQQTHREDADGTTWARYYDKRNRPDHAALQEESRRIHQANQRRATHAHPAPSEISNLRSEIPPTPPRQTPPTRANTCQTTPSENAPAQNEPTPADPRPPSPEGATDLPSPPASTPAGEGRGEGRSAPPGATPRNTAQQNTPPAQNEPTLNPSSHEEKRALRGAGRPAYTPAVGGFGDDPSPVPMA